MTDTERTIEHLLAERPWQTYASLKRAIPSIRRRTVEGMANDGRIQKHNPGSHLAMQYGPRNATPPKGGVPSQAPRGSRHNALNTGWTGVVVAALEHNPGWHRGPELKELTGYEWAAVTANNLAKEGRAVSRMCADGRKAFAALGTPISGTGGLLLAVPTREPAPVVTQAAPPVVVPPAPGGDLASLAAALTAAESAYQQARQVRDAAREALIAAARGGQ
jgi:hypothetical protein